MKTILKVTMLFAFVAFANTLFATGNLRVNIVPLNADKALVAISSLTGSNLQIKVEDDLGRIVYFKETVDPGNNYRKVYNFSDLEDGNYKFTVVSDNLTTECNLQFKYGKIKVGEEKTTIEPFFAFENGLMKCTYLNFSEENTTLYFLKNDQLLYSKKIGNNFTISEALNLSKLAEGEYVAILASGDKEFQFPIEIK